jgi:hypothetical protein
MRGPQLLYVAAKQKNCLFPVTHSFFHCSHHREKESERSLQNMEIVGGEVPLTVGEVYAIVRRRRDERYAKNYPRFGLQSRSVPIVPQSSAHFQAKSLRGGAKKVSAENAAEVAASAAELAVHAAIGYEEVLLLTYLRRNGGAVYGPSSCYASSAAGVPLGDAVSGTRRYATIVDRQLDEWDVMGQQAERQIISQLRNIFAAADGAMANSTIKASVTPTGSEIRQLLSIRPTAPAHVYAVLGDRLESLSVGSAKTAAVAAKSSSSLLFPQEPPPEDPAEEVVRAITSIFDCS